MTTSIVLTQARRIAGTEQSAGATVSVSDGLAQELVALGLATISGRSPADFSLPAALSLAPLNEVRGLVGPAGQVIPVGRYPRNQGGVFCDWQASSGTLAMVSTDAGDDIALDTAKMLDGISMAKCTFSNAASGTFIAEFTFANAVSLKGYKTIQVPVEITCNEAASGVGQAATPFQIWMYPSGGGTIRLLCEFDNIPPGGRHVFTFGRESPAGLVTFSGTTASSWDILDSQTITKVRIVQGTIAASVSYPVWVGSMRADARAQAFVSIVMDGEYSSQYSLIKPLLDRYAFKTSLAVTYADIGTAGRMSFAQLDECNLGGHELILHCFDSTKTGGYANATDWPSGAVISEDIRAGFSAFRARGWKSGIGKIVNSFTNPFVSGTAQARQKLVYSAMRAAGVECSRASAGLYTAQMSLGFSGVKPFHVRGGIQISNTHTAADVIAKIDQAENNGEWCVITIHRAVQSSPGSLEMTVAEFATWLDYLNERTRRGGVAVAPFGEVYDLHFK